MGNGQGGQGGLQNLAIMDTASGTIIPISVMNLSHNDPKGEQLQDLGQLTLNSDKKQLQDLGWTGALNVEKKQLQDLGWNGALSVEKKQNLLEQLMQLQ